MADDTMEICPVRYGDEDFDFDFDLTAPPEDEDSILEDVNIVEPSPTIHSKTSLTSNDSVMNDNDDSTFEMDDIENLAGDEKKENEPDTMSLTTGIELNIDSTQTNHLEPHDDQLYQESSIQNHYENHTDQIIEAQLAQRDYWEDEESLAECTNNDSLQEPVLSPQESETRHSVISSKHSDVAIKIPDNSLTSAVKVSDYPDKINGSNRSHSSTPSSPLDAPETSFKSETVCDKYELNDVIILYQANEYALYSVSELDDPNSFFIKDRSISQKPLSDFFRAIRDVVHEDLDDEGELLISIPELGLQVEETSLTTRDVNLSQLVVLRKKLLLNDGIETPQPLCIELGIRKSFMREFLRINTCANEGKGLSEIAPWGENCDNLKTFNFHKDCPRSPDQRFIRESCADDDESELNYTGLSTEYPYEASSTDGVQVEKSAENLCELTNGDEKRNSNGTCQPRQRESSISKSSYNSEPFQTFRSKYPILFDSVTEKKEADSNACCDEESDIIDYSEDDLEDNTQLAPQIKRVENECINESNWNSDRTIIKSSTPCTNDHMKTVESNAFSKNLDQSPSTRTNQRRNSVQNLINNPENSNAENPINTQDETLENDDFNNEYQDNDFDYNYESFSDPINHVEKLDHTCQVNDLRDTSLELNTTSDQNCQEDHKSPKMSACDIQIDKPREDILNQEIEDLLEDDETYQSNTTKDTSHNPKDLSITKESEIDTCSRTSHESFTEKTLVETKQMSVEPFSIDVQGAESEDEIGYDDDDEKSSINSEENLLNIDSNQLDSNRIPSINGKRSRIENYAENLLEYREIKRSRS